MFGYYIELVLCSFRCSLMFIVLMVLVIGLGIGVLMMMLMVFNVMMCDLLLGCSEYIYWFCFNLLLLDYQYKFGMVGGFIMVLTWLDVKVLLDV